MMSLWDALRMNMMISYQELVRTFPKGMCGGGMSEQSGEVTEGKTLMYRVGYGTNGDFGIYPTAF
ncbi:hypothetical protein C5X83_001610 [Klebsiella pneumoniae subsp. pneumoniae]|nr:hypothetical protein C5X83_001610 [Klebsiella pneumoniae subsp. pneumoniae]